MPVNTSLALETWARYQFCRDNGHFSFMQKADKCDKFFAGEQWDPMDLAKLRAEMRPALTINKILPTIGSVMGEQIKNRAEVSFRPRKNGSSEVADTLAKTFKQISDNNRLDWLRSGMFDDGVITSRGFLDARMDYSDSLTGEVRYTKLNPKNVVIDPDADDYDPDTWSDVLVTKWLTADDIEVLYGKVDANILRHTTESYMPYGYDSISIDRSRFGSNLHANYGDGFPTQNVSRNIRLVDRQYRKLDRQEFFVNPRTGDLRPVPEGWDRNRIALLRERLGWEVIKRVVRRIRWTIIADHVVLHDDWSPYKHFTVVPYFPYFRHGRTIGLVENLLGPQELLNKTTSQELHIVNSSANGGWKLKTGSLKNMDVEDLERNGAKTGLVMELDDVKDAEKITSNGVPTGLDRLSYKAEESIKSISNVSDSALGQDRADVAAKAIQAKKQASTVTLIKPLDSLEYTDMILARNTLDLVQEFYSEERILSITTDPTKNESETFTINQMTPSGEIANNLTIGEYDVIVASVPVHDTSEDSEFEQAVGLRELGVDIPDEVLIESSRLRNKKLVLEKIAARTQSPQAQAQAKLELEMMTAEVEKLRAEIAKIQADAGLKAANVQAVNVKTQKDAATPPEDNGLQVKVMEAQADMELEDRKFEHQRELDYAEMQHKQTLEQQESAVRQQQMQQQAVADRINRNKPQTETSTK